MQTLKLVTQIAAPIGRCFDLALSIDLELEAFASSKLQGISGKTSGQIGFGERVRWKVRQFGFTVTHESEITAYDSPTHFQDRMVTGLFKSFQHDHYFTSSGPQHTEMRDVLTFSMPLLLTGVIGEKLVVGPRLTSLLQKRNEFLKDKAERATS